MTDVVMAYILLCIGLVVAEPAHEVAPIIFDACPDTCLDKYLHGHMYMLILVVHELTDIRHSQRQISII